MIEFTNIYRKKFIILRIMSQNDGNHVFLLFLTIIYLFYYNVWFFQASG
jgi:hypothetical protein